MLSQREKGIQAWEEYSCVPILGIPDGPHSRIIILTSRHAMAISLRRPKRMNACLALWPDTDAGSRDDLSRAFRIKGGKKERKRNEIVMALRAS